ncbi:MAG: S9 family peptidase [Gemmatimonadetes bacterium]|nr:S9 family peptidase [Gemmatimonadota bacterium]
MPLFPLLPALAAAVLSQPAGLQVSAAQYAKAESRLPANVRRLVLRDSVAPRWIAGDRFWYRVATDRGVEFVMVDPARRARRPAFDHHRLAAALGRASDTTLHPDTLPFAALGWDEVRGRAAITVETGGKGWRCELDQYRCLAAERPAPPDPKEARSPDGRWAIYLENHNLWVREVATGARRALTRDGERRNDYASTPESNTMAVTAARLGLPVPPAVLWSPDSRRVLSYRLDQRRVPDLHLLQHAPPDGQRPKLWTFAFPMPGDSVARLSWLIFEVATGAVTPVEDGSLPVAYRSPISFQEAWWHDSATVYYLDRERGVRAMHLKEVDVATGRVRTVFTERGKTLVEATPALGARPNVRVSANRAEVIWWSERDGWAHLYLVDAATGAVKQQITKGPWVVQRIVRVDERARRLWFLGGGREPGRDPYYSHLYSVGFDGGGLTLLTPEDAHHEIEVSPSGAWLVDRYSRVDLPTRTVVRSLDGRPAFAIEEADISRLTATGWRFPERFAIKAADDSTELFGILLFPSDFDPARRYPVIDEIYPGPQVATVPKAFFAGSDLMALAELGFIGIQIDGRGKPGRSKAFHDYSYGRLETGGGLEDHLTGYRQLARTREYLDLDRIGIYGHSGGGFASTRAMLMYPEVYKVAVSSAGNHDQRGYLSLWGETYQGMPSGDNYAAQANPSIANRLQGKLLLAFADLDDNVPPALTIQVIEALTKANKDYDLLIMPNGSHAMSGNPYFRRRRWDYFVEHLGGRTPPKEYLLRTPSDYPWP